MALDLNLKSREERHPDVAHIILGAEVPKNWKENWAAQDDEKYQELEELWYREEDPILKAQRSKELNEYWAKRRVELGFTGPEE